MKKKNYLIISGIIFIVIIIGVIIWYSISVESKNFIKLNYSEVLEKVNNKESFILCVSASECIHCNSYRPKLKKISNDYNIKIYYTDVDKFRDDDYKEFKDKFSFNASLINIVSATNFLLSLNIIFTSFHLNILLFPFSYFLIYLLK